MVVVDRQPEKAADPLPTAVRVELRHPEHGLEAVGQEEVARRFRSELPPRLHLDLLDMPSPTRPLLDTGQVTPCLLNRQLHRELPPEQWWPEPVEGQDHNDRQDDADRTGNEDRDRLW